MLNRNALPADEAEVTTKTIRLPLRIAGPAGDIEAVLTRAHDESAAIPHTVIVCHPHPLHGGTMNNKVVHYLAKSFNDLGATAVRFNYRGVGASAGGFGEGTGETRDALAVLDWARDAYPNNAIWLAGFSFGAYVALKASHQRPTTGLICVAPAVRLYDFKSLARVSGPWLVVQGDRDDVVSYDEVTSWAQAISPPLAYVPMTGAGHFFHGRLNDLQQVVTAFIAPHLAP